MLKIYAQLTWKNEFLLQKISSQKDSIIKIINNFLD